MLGVPFLAVAAWGARHRPAGRSPRRWTSRPARCSRVRRRWRGWPWATAGATAGRATSSPPPWRPDRGWPPIRRAPRPPRRATAARAGVEIPLRAVRWGRHEVGLRKVACTSRLGAYRTVGGRVPPVIVTTMPRAADFNAIDAMPRPAGLVGLHRSRRQGPGSEPAEVRPFRPGDRLRRINWAVSSRTGTLHVTSTWADRDAHVMLLLDTEHDVGIERGHRRAGQQPRHRGARRRRRSVSHYLRAGDRVSLVDLGRRVRDVPAGSGRRHLRRLLEVLVAAEPGAEPPRRRRAHPTGRRRARSSSPSPRSSAAPGRRRSPTSCSAATRWSSSTRCRTAPTCGGSPWHDPGGAAAGDRASDGDRPPRRARRARRALARPGHARRGPARRQPPGVGTAGRR